jgi:hypothetical protein
MKSINILRVINSFIILNFSVNYVIPENKMNMSLSTFFLIYNATSIL